MQEYNLKYVDMIEEQLNEALTTYRKPVDGDNYVRRSNQRFARVLSRDDNDHKAFDRFNHDVSFSRQVTEAKCFSSGSFVRAAGSR